MKINIAILLLAAGVFASCKSSTSPPSTNNNNNNNGGTPSNSMVLTIGTTVDTFTTQQLTSVGPTLLVIGTLNGSNNGVTAAFSLLNVSGPGQYNIGNPGASSSGALMNIDYTDSGSVSYSSANTSGTSTGVMKVAQVSSTSLQATFTDTLYLVGGNTNSPQKIVVTNGSINAQ